MLCQGACSIEKAQNRHYLNLHLLIEVGDDFQRAWILLLLCFYWLYWEESGVQEAIIKEEGNTNDATRQLWIGDNIVEYFCTVLMTNIVLHESK